MFKKCGSAFGRFPESVIYEKSQSVSVRVTRYMNISGFTEHIRCQLLERRAE